jgi:ferredoxin
VIAQGKTRILKKSRVVELLDNLAQCYDLIGPVRDNTISFGQVKSGSEVTLDFANSVLPLKSLFSPQTETLFRFAKDGEGFKLQPGTGLTKERVIFGVRACDVRSLHLLDMVFDGQFKDSFYLQKRAKSILIGLACLNPDDTCFCHTFGVDPTSAEGVDILFTDLDNRYWVEASTERGAALLSQFAEFFDEPLGDEAQLRDAGAAKLTGMKKLNIEGMAEKMKLSYESDYWNRIATKCLGCGICTYLCPTCYCFDLVDENRGEGGERFRSWDSCMFSDFTLMASGENPRPTGKERVQQRFFHKFKYFHDQYATMACVGCGRCLKYCPVNVDITQIIGDVMSGKTGDE